jgi:uncharacterized protein YjbI with pentapeptide repeats
MTNKKHLAIFKKGVRAWNKWREENPDVWPKLGRLNLRRVNLRNANLSFTDLDGANLSEAVLSGANLVEADLREANLRRANLADALLSKVDLSKGVLREADFSRAQLFEANLTEADLTNAILQGTALVEVKLRNAVLKGANLGGADLSGSELGGSNLSGANLSDVKLLETNLREANLAGAVLKGTNLTGADFTGADFAKAKLIKTLFWETKLENASFSRAFVGSCFFGDVDLSSATGLERVVHLSPSEIGLKTISRAEGKIPETFLQGTGLSDDLLPRVSALGGDSSELCSCLISHSAKDRDFAASLSRDLRKKGIRCWFIPEEVKDYFDLWEPSYRKQRAKDNLLIVLSENSIDSFWLHYEIERATVEEEREEKKMLHFLRLDDSISGPCNYLVDIVRKTRPVVDFTLWKKKSAYRKALDQLLSHIRSKK